MLILISDAFGDSLPDRLSKFGEVTDDKSRITEAEVVLIRSKTNVTKKYISVYATSARAISLLLLPYRLVHFFKKIFSEN